MGGSAYWVVMSVGAAGSTAAVVCAGTTVGTRLAAVTYGWNLPTMQNVKYHGRGGPWLRRGLWREASGTTGGEFNSTRARPCGDSRGTGDTRTHRECHRNRGRLLLPWRVCPWASAPSRGRDTGPAHRVLPRGGCAGFARPITWAPYHSRASRYLKTGTQPSVRASPPPTVGRGTRAAFRLDLIRD